MLNKKKGVVSGIVQAFMWIYCSFTVFVLGYMIYNSLRPKQDILTKTFEIPKNVTLDNFVRLFKQEHFLRYFSNSVFILVFSLLLIVIISSLTAYGLARYNFKGKSFFRIYFLIGLMFPVQLGIVPIFLLMKKLALINTSLSVILVSASGISMSVLMLTNFFAELPEAVYEAAILDGAGEFRTFFSIMLPMATPVIFSVCITTSVQIWNQFFLPLIFLQSDDKKTIPMLILKNTAKLLNTIDLAMASSVLSTIPILILFVIFSNKILDGVTSGSVKG